MLTRDSRFLDRDEWPWTGALVNNIRWLIVYPILCLFLGLLTAVLATRVRYEAAFKAIIFVPMAISATAVGVIWLLVYSPDPNIGVLNATLTGLGGDPVSWLGRGDTANYAIILAYVWASTGFVMVVLSAALKGISTGSDRGGAHRRRDRVGHLPPDSVSAAARSRSPSSPSG